MISFSNPIGSVSGLRSLALLALLITVACALSACNGSEQDEAASLNDAPLRPLIYTELPGLTPEGAAVREERMMRHLIEGITDGPWGSIEAPRAAPPAFDTVEGFGTALVDALLHRDRDAWEQAFVSPAAYVDLVHVRAEEAAEFVDNQIGASRAIWQRFDEGSASELPEGGLASVFEFQKVELGRGRRVDGALASEEEEAVQFWGNRVLLRHRDSDVVFELTISRIFHIRDATTDGPRQWQIASPVEAGRKLGVFLDAGLHLKPQLLRPSEYPFPLNVGNFWRYRRFDAKAGAEEIDPLERGLRDVPSGPAATQVIVEILQVSQYGPLRLAQFQRTYDDADHSRVREWWVATPRRVYLCDRRCRESIEDLDRLLDYFAHQPPLFRFPLHPGDSWGPGGNAGTDFRVDEDWHLIEAPAGTFPASFAIEGVGPLRSTDRFLRGAELTRFFSPGRGIVERTILSQENPSGPMGITEELVEYRITQ